MGHNTLAASAILVTGKQGTIKGGLRMIPPGLTMTYEHMLAHVSQLTGHVLKNGPCWPQVMPSSIRGSPAVNSCTRFARGPCCAHLVQSLFSDQLEHWETVFQSLPCSSQNLSHPVCRPGLLLKDGMNLKTWRFCTWGSALLSSA